MRRSMLTLVFFLFVTPAWAAKPKIAILGLEGSDANGKPAGDVVAVAKQLTEGLRNRAKVGSGPFVFAPGSSLDLADEKKAAKCASEAVQCMAPIGASLNADVLLYGHVRKTKDGYEVSLKLIAVPSSKMLGVIAGHAITTADAGDPLVVATLAKSLYNRLTAQP
jgi:hypothetical protein